MPDFDTETYAKENGFNSAKVNDDGSVSINMSKVKHAEIMKDFEASIDENFAEMIGAEDSPFVKDIKHTSNFRKIDIYVDKSGYDSSGFVGVFLPITVYFSAAYYQAFSGADPKCEINIIDDDTKETIESVTYPDSINNKANEESETSSDNVHDNEGPLGDYYVKIKNAYLVTDYDGDTAILITYEWENNSSDTTTALSSVSATAFQDGVEIGKAPLYADQYDYEAESKKVRPGAAVDVQVAFKLSNETSVVEIEISKTSWYGEREIVYATFDPTTLERK